MRKHAQMLTGKFEFEMQAYEPQNVVLLKIFFAAVFVCFRFSSAFILYAGKKLDYPQKSENTFACIIKVCVHVESQ